MEAHQYTRIATVLALAGVMLLNSGCNLFLEVLSCNGEVENAYDIPDIVLVANAERYVRDLEARPHVFYQTEGESLFFEAESSNHSVADAYVDEYGLLTVVAGRPGRTHVVVEAHDSCHGWATTSFRVDVVRYGTTDSEKQRR